MPSYQTPVVSNSSTVTDILLDMIRLALASGAFSATPENISTADVSRIGWSLTSVLLGQLSSNDDRELIIYNEGAANVYVKYGTGASATSYTVKLESGATLVINNYRGVVHGLWSTDLGAVQVTKTSVTADV